MGKAKLPVNGSSEYYEIRLESIGGLGANLCGKMLGELGVKYLGLNSSSFSSYGSEKTGTPVKGFIRYCDKDREIRVHSPVISPNLLVVFHQALLKDESVLAGCGENTEIIVGLDGGVNEISGQIPGGIKACYVINAQQIAMETHSRINVVMLGAMAKVMGFMELEDVNQICGDTLGKKYPDALQGNLEGIRRGYEEIKELTGSVSEFAKGTAEKAPGRETASGWGYATAPEGGINPRFGSSVVSDLSPSRQGYIPLFIKERCINCGLCDSTCPDMVFQFVPGKYKDKEMMVNKGLDYYHCKGCLRCVEVCPVNALVRGLEAEHPYKEYFLPNKDLVRTPDYYLKTGADGYVTSESYLTEKRMGGGEV
ncbi:pyruvate synthase subunit PorC [Lachnospiraceae bacterium]|jgi:2-oxoacid:acceptor oxidoreductase, gamma subunit, pyruvate/2-ketoisovalerate family|nr:pyruvate synthase subunit PorC [Lachnospiraceae bacterium]